MPTLRSSLFALLGAAALLPASLQAQVTDPEACWLRGGSPEEAMARTSPLGVVQIPLGDDAALVCYSRPSARERPVVGNLIPIGEPWRMGANEPTQLHTPVPLEMGDMTLEPGIYSLYVIAGEEEWEILVNTNYQRWGIPIDQDIRATEVGSVTRPVQETEDFVETFTISWEPHGGMMGHLVMEWENTRVELPIHTAGMSH